MTGMHTASLRGGGRALILAMSGDRVPWVLHWGMDPGDIDDAELSALAEDAVPSVFESAPDRPRVFSVLPGPGECWSGTPGLVWDVPGASSSPRWRLRAPVFSRPIEGGEALTVDLETTDGSLEARLAYGLPASGILRVDCRLRVPDAARSPVELRELTLMLPVPGEATEMLDFTGEWCGERRPQRRSVADGAFVRATRRGRPGHDSPFLTVIGEPGFRARSGRVWAAHLGWSGDARVLVERLPEGSGLHGAVLGGGPALAPREGVLDRGETFESPAMHFAASDRGLDGLAESWHEHLRSLPSHPERRRPLTLNTWEAVYFRTDREKLHRLVDRAADVGVERFVLDDGWFLGRRDAQHGLGDWSVDPEVWPDGLEELADHVHARGMEFGLWFEPEMVNPDSLLAREHPEWILGPADGPLWRGQRVVDLSRREAFAAIRDRMAELIARLGVDYVKWDHNRDILEPLDGAGRAGTRAHTRAVYALIDELRVRFPALEIESCASGGGRIDLGILERTHRIWASDTNDPLERQRIQHWTGLLVPPERMGTHVGPGVAHTTHRSSDLSMRLATALFGHAGFEWDLDGLDDDELDALRAWAALYKELRHISHRGRRVSGDPDDEGFLTGFVSEDRTEAVFSWVRLGAGRLGANRVARFEGLDPAARYRVRIRGEIGETRRFHASDPSWVAEGRIYSEAALRSIGLPMSALAPGQAQVIHLTAVAS